MSVQQSRILDVLRKSDEPSSYNDIADSMNISYASAKTQLHRLMAEGLVCRTEDGKWIKGATTGQTSGGLINRMVNEVEDDIRAMHMGENNVVELNPIWDEFGDETELMINDPKTFFKTMQSRIQELKQVQDLPFFSVSSLPYGTELRALGADHRGKLVMVEGDVVSYQPIGRRIVDAVWECPQCRSRVITHYHVGDKVVPPQVKDCNHQSRPTLVVDRCLEEDEQWFILEESSYDEAVKPGVLVRVPAWLVERNRRDRKLRVGNNIRVVGIYRSYFEKNREGDLVPVSYVEASSFSLLLADIGDLELSEEEVVEIKAFASEERVLERLEARVAPFIHGMALAKRLTLLSSVYEPFNEISGRQNVNIILLGHTGTGKSSIFDWWRANYPRALMSSGSGGSNAGLYGFPMPGNDRLGGRFTVIAGLIPRADGGIAIIDEAEKQIERYGGGQMYEAMEHRRIRIDKGDVHTTLRADCPIWLAANWRNMLKPDPNSPLIQYVPKQLSSALLARCVVHNCDKGVSPDDNRLVSSLIARKHQTARVEKDGFFIKYLCAAKRVRAVLSDDVVEAVQRVFLDWESRSKGVYDVGMEITKRLMEDFLRLVKSCAMLHLREETTMDDVFLVMPIFQHMLEEFAGVEGGYDISLVSGAVSSSHERLEEDEIRQLLDLKGGLDLTTFLADVPGADIVGLEKRGVIVVRNGIIYKGGDEDV